jgi:hypothetical protein
MLQPFEVDLLRQDLQQALKLLGQDEIDDARALMREKGFDAAEFEISQRTNSPGSGATPVTGTVTLTRSAGRGTRVYEAGNSTSWLTAFERDLEFGAFGLRT